MGGSNARLDQARDRQGGPGERDWFLWDEELRGFGVKITPAGTKTFIVQYRADRRSRRFTIGRYGTLTPDEGRREARKILGEVAKGGDPQGEKVTTRTAPVVNELLDRYLAEHVEPHNAASTAAMVRDLVERLIRPALGHLKVDAVSSNDVARLHRSLGRTSRQANHVIAIVSKAFGLAELWQLRPRGSNPAIGIKRFKEKARERFLSDEELERLGGTLVEAQERGLPWHIRPGAKTKHLPKDIEERRSQPNPTALAAIRLLLLTGARLSEVINLKWSDVDFEAGTFLLPGRKGGLHKAHPVGSAALDLLARQPRLENSPYVFARVSDPSRPISKEVMESVWQRLRRHAGLEDVRLHDLRHTAGTYFGQMGANAFLIRDMLRHKTLAMTGRYVNESHDPMRAAYDALEARILAGLAGNSDDGKA